ncbi:MAG: hypothetical protein MUD10_04885 [Candidatus Pacebacteria bacterium]|jgi:hypothetical protein|nr:hypothetical protein [Candidatus Paceibacterota bacterium]
MVEAILLAFALGMAFEGARLLGLRRMERNDFRTLAFIMAISLVCGAAAAFRLPAPLPLALKAVFGFCVAFPFLYLFAFKKKVFPKIDERTLLAWTLIFVYVAADYVTNLSVLVPAALVSAAVIIPLLFDRKMPRPVKTVFYLWYIFVAAVFGVSQFDLGTISGGSGVLIFFLKGMASLYLMMCVLQIFLMVPIPGKYQSISDRIAQWHDDANLMAQKFSDRQASFAEMALIIAAVSGLLAANAYFKLFRIPDLVSTAMVLTSLLPEAAGKIKNLKTAASAKI